MEPASPHGPSVTWDGFFAEIQACIQPGTPCEGLAITEVLTGALSAVLSTAPAEYRLVETEAVIGALLTRVERSLLEDSTPESR